MPARLRAVLILTALSVFAAWTTSAQAQLPSLSIDDAELPEGGPGWTASGNTYYTPFPFLVTLSAASTETITVEYKTKYLGTAWPNGDYQEVEGLLTFDPGETEKTITVWVQGDPNDEPTMTFGVELSNATHATIARGLGIGTILNDDPPPAHSDFVMTIISPRTKIHVGDPGTITFQITNNGPEDVQFVGFWIEDKTATAEASQGPGCYRGFGSPSFFCSLYTIAAGATATVKVTVYDQGLYCPEAERGISRWPQAYVRAPFNTDPNPANNDFGEIHYSDWLDVQPNITPSTLNLAVGSTQPLTVQVSSTSGNTTLDVSADDKCVGVPATVVTSLNQPFTATIPVTALSVPCTTHVNFSIHGCGVHYSVPITTYALPTVITFDPSSPTITAGQTVHVHVTASPLSAPAAFGLLALTRTIDVPPSVVIDPVTGGDIPITGVIGGAFSLSITAPPALGSTTSTLSGQVLDAPTSNGLSAVAPNSGSTNGGTLVRLSGSGFTPNCWPFFDSLAARNVIVEGTTSLVAGSPRHGAGTVNIALRCSAAAELTLNNGFTYIAGDDPAPLVTSVDPLSAAPGQPVTIHGLHFRANDTITFGSAAATSVSSAPDAHLALVPSLSPGTVSVNVTDVLGRLSTTGPIFTVLDNTPQVTHISPTSLPAGAELTIDGSGFRAPYTFTIGGQTARIVTMSFNRAIVRVPALAPGSYELRVVNATGQIVANGGSLTVTQSGLVISSAEPSCARADGGSVLHILGGGFASGATLTIGDVSATNVAVSDASHVIATLPPLPPGRATAVVRNPNGESATATNAVAVYSPFDPDGCPASYKTRAVRH
ncbi:MAG: large repetitive protein [Thermoanaerobaculia bacterium]|jgi:hypothetical protein|nr:large repetitive protein [Thermoanaerobaculia bacterium]